MRLAVSNPKDDRKTSWVQPPDDRTDTARINQVRLDLITAAERLREMLDQGGQALRGLGAALVRRDSTPDDKEDAA